MSFTEIIYGILFEPVPTLRYLAENKPLVQGLIVFLSVLIFNIIMGQGNAALGEEVQALTIPFQLGWFINIVAGIFSFIMLFVMAAVFSLLGELFYGKGNAAGLLVCFAFASIPGVLGPALQYVSTLAGIEWLAVFLSLAVGIWVLVLQVLALREALALDTGQAVIVFLIPLAIVIALLILFGVAAVAFMPLANF